MLASHEYGYRYEILLQARLGDVQTTLQSN